MTPTLTIGTLAQAAGVGVETVRYYQRRRLLPEPPRPLGGIRRYGEADLARLRFIRHAQELGFSLAEVAELLALDEGRDCDEARACDRSGGHQRCPLIETLATQSFASA